MINSNQEAVPLPLLFLYSFLREFHEKWRKMSMKYKIFTVLALLGSTVAELFGGWDTVLKTLLIFMVLDWFTGGIILPAVFCKSPKSPNGALESRTDGSPYAFHDKKGSRYIKRHIRKPAGVNNGKNIQCFYDCTSSRMITSSISLLSLTKLETRW